MIHRPLAIAIVGAGTAGSAAAIFLSRAGHVVTLFERVPDPGPLGAGIMMQPSGLAVLDRLGASERVLDRGARVSRLLCESHRGDAILDLEYEALAADLFGIGLHRGVLFETLFGAVQTANVEILCGVSVARISRTTRSGRFIVTESDERLGPFDLVVVCDGARSHLRDELHEITKRVSPYPWGALWFIGEDPNHDFRGVLHQKVRGTREMIGTLPTGLGPGIGETPQTSLFFSVLGSEVDALKLRGLAAWKDRVREIAPQTEPLLAQIHDLDQLTFASYFDVVMPRWHAHDIVFLGDAAHATSPQLGQGCNLALCDAATLADALAESSSVARALDLYSSRRRDQLAYYQLATRWLTPFFQSDFAPLGWMRDLLMPRFSRFGYVRREMVRSMCGTKTSLVFSS
jgi:2-polyprenyl-6-methoxyphenol hydroxylase-like FAD-dependent oxidoreductase